MTVIVVDPGLRPVANPASLIVATVVSLLVHVTPIPATPTGVKASVVVPLPSRPSVFCPQHCTEPFGRRAQLCTAPDVAAVAVVIPVTGATATAATSGAVHSCALLPNGSVRSAEHTSELQSPY